MSAAQPQQDFDPRSGGVAARFRRIRKFSESMVLRMAPEDTVVQSMPDASPAKWHLAHTTWFFEHFVLSQHAAGYTDYHPRYDYLFNSYYFTVGQMFRRPDRGMLSRPTLAEILAWREHVDNSVLELIQSRADDEALQYLIELGLNHEQQHQELILTDIKHLFSLNPLQPALVEGSLLRAEPVPAMTKHEIPIGPKEIGATGDGFHFDNETPRHETLLRGGYIASRLVTNGEYLEFIDEGGYQRPELWLSDGWAGIQQQGWQRPLYWNESLDGEFTLHGAQDLLPNRPVCHISLFEADAYARWAGARLPREEEWEAVAETVPVAGKLLDDGDGGVDAGLHPVACQGKGLQQLYGDAWEWTASPYTAYPGFKPLAGSLGEYNGKFMCSQNVLRGGSCMTPVDHIRASYRNFFYPDSRWQFSGIRLAWDE